MKKLLALTLVFAMLASLMAGCSSDDNTAAKDTLTIVTMVRSDTLVPLSEVAGDKSFFH